MLSWMYKKILYTFIQEKDKIGVIYKLSIRRL